MKQSTQTEAYFDIIRQRIADGGYIWCRQFGSLLEQDTRAAGPGTLLDVGCQAGQLYQIVKTIKGLQYFGIDIEAQYLDVGRQIFPGIADAISEASVLELDPSEPYDYVTASAVLEHIEDSDIAFDRILTNTRRFALVRTFVQAEAQSDQFKIDGAPNPYLIKAFSYAKMTEIANRNTCTIEYIEDEATESTPYLIGASTCGHPIWRTMRVVKFSK